MLSAADNELLTRTGPGTAMGDLFRRFWMPALLSRALPEPDGPPVRVKILGEELVAFRDTEGRVGLVEPHCPHRGANSGSALADRGVPFAEVMVQRFGDAVGRVGLDPSGAHASRATYSSPRSSLSR
jgi:hypothetical protein